MVHGNLPVCCSQQATFPDGLPIEYLNARFFFFFEQTILHITGLLRYVDGFWQWFKMHSHYKEKKSAAFKCVLIIE